ncbi:ornithine carbamoyltransferase [Synoicihabitans lomoniglobus]|uniref:Ornithine carbamoyltransferase n=1 Tax=Synoicihabitans lomoniglobus TaxID=2909285 RepID=A0AAF0CMX5_9BACT|nr:ornithine carbamoyltransferase [Opitutaceae bacterium LMO-M01]WED63906.1 ornithine carbamoyltransferase [Opitutaceae bacterium LMO-M01]
MKHFLKETDLQSHEVAEVFALAREFKAKRGRHVPPVLAQQTWAMIFSKSSTRTRVSFEVGIHELGGNPLFLNRNDIQLDRGESIEDTAKVLSRFVHGLIVRTHDHSDVERLAAAGSVPVINALTDFLHPCQIYTDAFTMAERWAERGGDLLASLKGRKIAFLGDTACNMPNSWILGAGMFGMQIALAGPAEFEPTAEIKALATAEGFDDVYTFTTDPFEAVKDADVVYTDVWVSMGKEEETKARLAQMAPYQVTEELFASAKPDALFMHCLPAHAGEEVSQGVLDNERCIIFDQAENRLHTQKAIMAVLAQQPRG